MEKISLLAIGLCCGGAGYYLAPFEPPILLVGIVLSFACLIIVWGFIQQQDMFLAVGFLAASACLGMGYAQMTTLNIKKNFSFISTPEYPVHVEGMLIDEEFIKKGTWRLTLGDVRVDGHEIDGKVRLRNMSSAALGTLVAGKARLFAPSPPSIPHGFDFQRYAFFREFAAVGYFIYEANLYAQPPQAGIIADWRENLYAAIERDFAPHIAGVVRALLLGDRQSLDEEQMQQFRSSGLAHLLAISGMHIGMITLLVFTFIRRMATFFPKIVYYHDVHRYAAVFAVLVAYLYVLLTGGPVSMQRAFIMIAILMAGWVLERGTIRFRSLSLAAILVFLIQPHMVIEPSFQLSFTAVMVLIGYWQFRYKLWQNSEIHPFLRGIVDVFVSSLLISVLLVPILWGHFQTFYPYGALANLLAIPWMGLLVMPFLMIYTFAGFVDLEIYIAPFLSHTLEFLLWWTKIMADLPLSQIQLPFIPTSLMILSSILILIIFLISSVPLSARFLGYSLIIFATFGYATLQPLPVLIVDRSQSLWAWVDDRVIVIPERAQKPSNYIQREWSRRLNLPIIAKKECASNQCRSFLDLDVTEDCLIKKKQIYLGNETCENTLFDQWQTFMVYADEQQDLYAISSSEVRGIRPWVLAAEK